MHCYTPKRAMAALAIAGWISNRIIQTVFDIFVSLMTFYESFSSMLDVSKYPDSLEHYVPTKKPKHLGIVLSGEHGFDTVRNKIVEDVVDLAYWAIQAQIWMLTSYRREGKSITTSTCSVAFFRAQIDS